MKRLLIALFAVLSSSVVAQNVITPPTTEEGFKVIELSKMDLSKTTCGWSTPKANKSIEGHPITIAGKTYASGVGTHATGRINVKLNGSAMRFKAQLGIDDEVVPNKGNVKYTIKGIGENGLSSVLAEGTIVSGGLTQNIDVDVNGYKYLIIDLDENGENSYDHVDVANAYFTWDDDEGAASPPYIVSNDEIGVALACATAVFSQPGVRFMHKIRASQPNALISVSNLPKGLKWNAERCLVDGSIKKEGVYTYYAIVENDGEVQKMPITLTVSKDLQQPVPFMGWLSWNVWEEAIDEKIMLETANAAKRYGLDKLGYQYLCLDDWWHCCKERPADGFPDWDHAKFPNGMRYLTDTLHALGFKAGIYSDAAAHTCAGAFASYGYEKVDAKAYADWGFDLLKYDYCGAPPAAEEAQRRYTAMGNALKESGRNILFYMCEWGPREPWKWGAETGATCWRCTYDSRDYWDWGSKANGGHIGVIQGVDVMKHLWAYSGVNRFNDADMMMVGLHGTGRSSSYDAANYPTGRAGMTQEEYQSQFSLWAMYASPLTLSFDIRNISDDDLRIISNKEMIAINQDRMGQAAELVSDTLVSGQQVEVYVKDLENGDMAVAVFNRGAEPIHYTFFPEQAYLKGNKPYRFHDVWGVSPDKMAGPEGYDMQVLPHQTRVFRVSRK